MAAKTRTRRPKFDADARAAQWKALSDRLAGWQAEQDEAGDEGAALVAAALAMHDGYSERNAMLIAMQDEQATEVRGYVDWQANGRQVSYPGGEFGGITIVAFRGESKGAKGDDAKADANGKADAKADGNGKDGDKKPSLRFSLATVHDVRFTEPITCEVCAAPIRRTGRETREQMQARDGRRQAALWAHAGGAPADGHTARKPYRPAPAGDAGA